MTRHADLGDVRTAYEVRGAGPAILLVHGLQGGRRMLQRLADALAADFTVVDYDQRDSGDTTNPAAPYDLRALADDAAALIAALGHDRVHVFGTSFGGRIAQALAALHPERVDGLVLGSTWALGADLAALNPEGLRRFMDIRSRLPESRNELAEFFAPADYLRGDDEARRMLVGMPDEPARAARRAQAAQTSAGAVAAIHAPALVLSGSADEMVPTAASAALADAIPGATLRVLPGVGHATTLQAPAELAAAIRDFVATSKTAA